jgi:hypothetical protein
MAGSTLNLNARQIEALLFIGEYFDQHGCAPTSTEICTGLGYSPKTRGCIHSRVQLLRLRGYLTTQEHRARQVIVLSDAGRAFCKKHSTLTNNFSSQAARPSGHLPAKPVRVKSVGVDREHLGGSGTKPSGPSGGGGTPTLNRRARIHLRPVMGVDA